MASVAELQRNRLVINGTIEVYRVVFVARILSEIGYLNSILSACLFSSHMCKWSMLCKATNFSILLP